MDKPRILSGFFIFFEAPKFFQKNKMSSTDNDETDYAKLIADIHQDVQALKNASSCPICPSVDTGGIATMTVAILSLTAILVVFTVIIMVMLWKWLRPDMSVQND
jgi:ABC-type transport system involved in cytochrome bd biosynthesis fused ATPase/permease subunit